MTMNTAPMMSLGTGTNMAALPVFGARTRFPMSPLGELLAASSIDNRLGRKLEPTPEHLSRVVFVPTHTDATTHLPLYEISESYRDAVKAEPVGGSNYKLKLALMRKPTGDGTHGEVRYLVDFRDGAATVERRVPGGEGEVASVSLPNQGDGSFEVESANADRPSRLSLAASLPITETEPNHPRSAQKPWFAISHHASGATEPCSSNLEWQIRPVQHGALRYTLTDSRAAAGAETVVHAIYHHVGIAFGLPHDYSQGVLLLSEDLSDQAEALAVATLLGLLHQVRRLNQPPPRPKRKSLVKRVLEKI
ncbi:hypothetical protein CMUS01_14231 [Colletotrichum musicola]|uniref:Uncharacterized protein n=1 Tax=Colletotrichum musicola TaxID=2175873 RepID=A0A8H6J6G0_9PEZI|nr:hypothetical protein CMUS01_14231 [Colletotrichum musicola]